MQRHKLQKPLHTSDPSAHTQSNNHVSFTNLSPQTPAEHYWASRALKAEALLSAREKHYEEVGRVREEEEFKRRNDMQNLENRYKEKYNSLEKLVIALILTIMLLVALLVYLTTSHKQQNVGLINPTQSPGLPFPSFLWSGINSFNLNRKGSEPGSSGRFNFHLHLPAHFTIPILSPWASVVEHQTSNTTNTSTSSSFYLILLSTLATVVISGIIFMNYNRARNTLCDGKRHDPQQSLGPSNSIPQLLGVFLNPGLSSIALWKWAWSWGYKILRLIGVAPR